MKGTWTDASTGKALYVVSQEAYDELFEAYQKLKDTPGGMRIWGALNEIERLNTEFNAERDVWHQNRTELSEAFMQACADRDAAKALVHEIRDHMREERDALKAEVKTLTKALKDACKIAGLTIEDVLEP